MAAIILAIGGVAVAVCAMVGWILNVIALVQLDFASPYKAEAIRGVGVFMAPVGMVAGYITFDEEK